MATLFDFDTKLSAAMKTHQDLSSHMIKRQPLLNQVIISKGNIIEGFEARD